jgi:SH3-like domain-containing protein
LFRRLLVLLFLLAGMVAAGLPVLSPAAAQSTGLPLPRFVSLASDEINVRTGPGQMHPIRWVFNRRGVPVQIVEEAQDWRRIVDHEGETGWIHASLLSSRRTILVTGDTRPLRRTPRHDARIVALIEPMVIGTLLNCERNWCLVEVDRRRGWLERGQFYGTLESEMGG